MWLIALTHAGDIDAAWEKEGLSPPAPGHPSLGRDVRFVGWGEDRIAIATEDDPLVVVNLVTDEVLADHPEGLAATLDRHGIDRGGEVDFFPGDPAVLAGEVVVFPMHSGELWELWAVHPKHCGKVVHSARDRPEAIATLSSATQPRGAVLLADGTVVGVHLSKGYDSGGPADVGGFSIDLPKGWVERDGELRNTCAYRGNDMSDELTMDTLTFTDSRGADHRRPHPYSHYMDTWIEVHVTEGRQIAGEDATMLSWSMPGVEANDTWCREWEIHRPGVIQTLRHCTHVPTQSPGAKERGAERQAEVNAMLTRLRPIE